MGRNQTAHCTGTAIRCIWAALHESLRVTAVTRPTLAIVLKIEPILGEQVLSSKNNCQETRRENNNDYGDSAVRRSWRDRRGNAA